LGHDAEAVQEMFSSVLQAFEDDEEFIDEFTNFMTAESDACDLAELGVDGLVAKKLEQEKEQQSEVEEELRHGARSSTEIYTRGCHWIPRLKRASV
jgi:hypothetical protein